MNHTRRIIKLDSKLYQYCTACDWHTSSHNLDGLSDPWNTHVHKTSRHSTTPPPKRK